jgi:hypothetical protein
LVRYRDFFALFENFSGYVDFFPVQDLVSEDCSAVTVFPPFDDFKTPSVPNDVDTYREYRRRTFESSRPETVASNDTRPLRPSTRAHDSSTLGALSRHTAQLVNLPQPPVELVPTDENAARQP